MNGLSEREKHWIANIIKLKLRLKKSSSEAFSLFGFCLF